MKKIFLGVIILLPLLMSCEEDVSKVIQTDLPIEASEIFSISKEWNESLYFALISWEDYHQLDSVSLPSCPEVSIDENTKEVTLNFLSSTACIQTGQYGRSGKLMIKFDTTVLGPNKKWTMSYEDYHFGTNQLDGIRTFSSNDSIHVLEEFDEIIERSLTDVSSEFSGEFIHTKTYVNDSLANFSSVGRILGVNGAGRKFEISIDTPSKHFISCYQQNEILPSSGKENWFVSRGANSEVGYSTTYEALLEECKVAATATLPDGRKLRLNPIE
ncbi:hypothetical protein [Algoriphagus chordae]|uniref:Uncharacterized protein n=1 Tax=Algoriphagus chordae TaxID=237019 RepID=A0A2W7RA81_9BACT|nr:hypothetical protein [Algoriphagus chordae]PZX47475.1 hypothetical protein LV85_03966 [Algoriphagus chordae]